MRLTERHWSGITTDKLRRASCSPHNTEGNPMPAGGRTRWSRFDWRFQQLLTNPFDSHVIIAHRHHNTYRWCRLGNEENDPFLTVAKTLKPRSRTRSLGVTWLNPTPSTSVIELWLLKPKSTKKELYISVMNIKCRRYKTLYRPTH